MAWVSEYLWCTDCHRVYHAEEAKRAEGRDVCPYNDCGALDALAWEWSAMRAIRPELPLRPAKGMTYPSPYSQERIGG